MQGALLHAVITNWVPTITKGKHMFHTGHRGHAIIGSSITGYNMPPYYQSTVATPLHM